MKVALPQVESEPMLKARVAFEELVVRAAHVDALRPSPSMSGSGDPTVVHVVVAITFPPPEARITITC